VRLAVISNVLPPEGRGGAEGYAASLAATLAPRHEVLVLSATPSGEVGAAQQTTLPRLPALSPTAPLAEKLVWHARDQWRPTVHRATVRELQRFAPDVVHTHECQGLSAAVFTAIAATGLPHVHTAHDLNLLCARVTMTRNGAFCGGNCASCRVQRTIRGRAVKRHVSLLISVSEFIRRKHLDAGIVPAERAELVRLGAIDAAPRLRRPESGRLHIGFIGSLEPHKGIRTLLRAFGDTPDGWRLSVAGSGRMADEVVAAAAADSRIRYAGYVAAADKDSFFDEIDLLAIPSEWEEPAALVGIEALARGIPVLVSDRGGVPELAEARVFTAMDAESLRDGLDWFAADPARIESTSRSLVERSAEFSWTTHVARVEELLESVTSS
jgi:glycogen synthase